VCSQLPEMLTVEEAARVLRIGRTKAYALTREWRATGGRSGLCCRNIGGVLRVPRWAVEQYIGAGLAPPPSIGPEETSAVTPPATPPTPESTAEASIEAQPQPSNKVLKKKSVGLLSDIRPPTSHADSTDRPKRSRRRRSLAPMQASLFDDITPTGSLNDCV
jgi:hypothetical protein